MKTLIFMLAFTLPSYQAFADTATMDGSGVTMSTSVQNSCYIDLPDGDSITLGHDGTTDDTDVGELAVLVDATGTTTITLTFTEFPSNALDAYGGIRKLDGTSPGDATDNYIVTIGPGNNTPLVYQSGYDTVNGEIPNQQAPWDNQKTDYLACSASSGAQQSAEDDGGISGPGDEWVPGQSLVIQYFDDYMAYNSVYVMNPSAAGAFDAYLTTSGTAVPTTGAEFEAALTGAAMYNEQTTFTIDGYTYTDTIYPFATAISNGSTTLVNQSLDTFATIEQIETFTAASFAPENSFVIDAGYYPDVN
jgi:hypothetical protein